MPQEGDSLKVYRGKDYGVDFGTIAYGFVTLGRSERLVRCYKNLMNTTEYKNINFYVITEGFDQDTISATVALAKKYHNVYLLVSTIGTPTAASNVGFKGTKEPFYMFGSDDTEYTPDAISSLMEHFGDPNIQVVNAWDGLFEDGKSTYILRREYGQLAVVDEPGILYHEGYKHTYCDTEFYETAVARGVYKFVKNALVKHNHHMAMGMPTDATTHRMNNMSGNDEQLFHSRRHLWQNLVSQ